MKTRKERITQVLLNLKQSGDVEGSAVITRDGLLVASELSKDIDGDTLAAMSAAMQGAAETAANELKKTSPERVIVETKDTKIITTGAGEQAILACIVSHKAKLGLVLLEMKKAAATIKKEAK